MVSLNGEEVRLSGSLPQEKDKAPDFELVGCDLKRISLNAFEGKIKVINIFPSIDTQVCANSVRQFVEKLSNYPDIALINVSKDLPFAQERFIQGNKLQNAIMLSAFDSTFGQVYGLRLESGPLKGLLTRAVLVLDEKNTILYQEVVSEITSEPNYGSVLEVIDNYLKLNE